MSLKILKHKFFSELVGMLLTLYAISPYNKQGGFKYTFVLLFIWLFLIILYYPRVLKKIMFDYKYIVTYFFGIYLIFCSIINRAAILNGISIMLLLSMGLLYLVYKELKWDDVIKRTGIIALVYYLIINVYTLVELKREPSISRLLAVSEEVIVDTSKIPFVAGFDHIYSLTLLLVCLTGILLLKKEKISLKIFLLFLLITGGLTVRKSGYTYALLILLSFLVLLCMRPPALKRKRYLFICFLIPCILICILILPNVLNHLVNYFGGPQSAIGSRIFDLKEFLFNGGVVEQGRDAHSRLELYTLSINTWKKHLIFGVGGRVYKADGAIGGHSQILDYLGYYGLIGGILFVEAIYIVFNNIYKRIDRSIQYIFWLTGVEFILQLIVNPGFTMADTACLFIVIPCILNIPNRRSSFEQLRLRQ